MTNPLRFQPTQQDLELLRPVAYDLYNLCIEIEDRLHQALTEKRLENKKSRLIDGALEKVSYLRRISHDAMSKKTLSEESANFEPIDQIWQ